MPVAREGWPFIAGAWIVLAILAGLGWWIAALIWAPIALWVLAFFRDPPRNRIRGENLVLAPADGKVVSVIPIDEPDFLGGAATRVSIFMNVFSVHVNRYPTAGTVRYRQYTPGSFVNAAAEKASRENEQCSIGVEAPQGRMLIRQIAGLVARRIVTDHQPGREVTQGQRLGLIRFGSRVDLFLPPTATVTVASGATTRAGETVVARWT
jgi:phosphatidylserine decarboxylase